MRRTLNMPWFINLQQFAALLQSSITLWSEEWNANIQMKGWWRRGVDESEAPTAQGPPGDSQLHVWSFFNLMGCELLLVGCMMSSGGRTLDGNHLPPSGLSETSCNDCSKGRWRIMSGCFLEYLCYPLQAQPYLIRSIHPFIHSCVYVCPVQHTHTHLVPQFQVWDFSVLSLNEMG